MSQPRSSYWQPFRLFALLSLLSLLALRTGEPAYLLNLLFLLFLVPVAGKRSENQPAGLLPFVNRDGRKIVRWHRLVFVWIFVTSATVLGCCAFAYLLLGDWRDGLPLGLALGVTYSAVVTFDGFLRPVEELPSIQ